jgi:hypothetical protein
VPSTSSARPLLLGLIFAFAFATGACAPGNNPPSLVLIADQLVTVGERLQVTLQATDADGDAIDFEVTGLPDAAELVPIGSKSALLMWSPTTSEVVSGGREYLAEASASDGRGGVARQPFLVTALPSHSVPSIELPTGLTLDLSEKSYLTLQVEVRDDDSTEVAITLDLAPTGAQLLKSGPKSALLHWEPKGDQLLALVHSFTLTATDDTHPPVTHTMMVVLLGASDGAGCPGTSPTLVHTPLADQDLALPVLVLADAQDPESHVGAVALRWTAGDPETAGFHTVALLPSLSEDGRFEGELDPGDLPPGGAIIHYVLEASDNDDPTSQACDHAVRSPKEGTHRVGLYPAGASAQTCVDDSLEPDGSLALAQAVEAGTGEGRLCGATDDLRAIWVEGGSTLTARLVHTPEHGALSLAVLDGSGIEVDTASVNQGNLVVHEQAAVSGTRYVRVRSTDPDLRASYRLELSTDVAQCAPDALEPNDEASVASPLGPGVAAALEICPGDSDWYAVSVDQPSLVEVTLRSEPGLGDLDLVLTESSGTIVLASSLTYDPTERVLWTTATAADLRVYVYGYLGGVNAYEIEVEITPLGTLCVEDLLGSHTEASQAVLLFGDVVYTGLVACPQTPDWYAVDVNGGETLEVLVSAEATATEVELMVYEEGSDTPVATLSGPDVQTSWSLPWAGRLHMVVQSEVGAPYSLLYTLTDPPGPCPFDRFEPNDTDDTATAISPGVFTWLRLCTDDPADTFSLSLEPFDHLTITTHHAPGLGYTDLEVIDPAGELIDSELDPYQGVYLETVAQSAGVYTVRVLPYGVDAGLPYDLAIWVD